MQPRRTFPESLGHKQIAMIVIERRIRSNECVHHIDGDHSNDDPDNLLVMRIVDHSRYHNTPTGPTWLLHAFDWLAPPKTYISVSKGKKPAAIYACEPPYPDEPMEILMPAEPQSTEPFVIEQLPESRRFWKDKGYL